MADGPEKDGGLMAKAGKTGLDALQTKLDVVGAADPTPVTDLANAGISLARGDVARAGLRAMSSVPYVGDAVAKPLLVASNLPGVSGQVDSFNQGVMAKLHEKRANGMVAEAQATGEIAGPGQDQRQSNTMRMGKLG